MTAVLEQRSTCQSSRHDTAQAYRKHGCRCPKARTAEMARKAHQYHNRADYHAFVGYLRGGSFVTPGVPTFHWDPRRGCADIQPDVMFPQTAEDLPAAQKVCRRCPFKQACHQWAVDTAQPYGVWGGIGEKERRREIFARRKAVAA